MHQAEYSFTSSDPEKPGVVFWAIVAVGMTLVVAVTVILTVGMVLGLMHCASHALEWMAALQRARQRGTRLTFPSPPSRQVER